MEDNNFSIFLTKRHSENIINKPSLGKRSQVLGNGSISQGRFAPLEISSANLLYFRCLAILMGE